MKYLASLLMLPLFLHANPTTDLVRSKEKDTLIQHILEPNSKKFNKKYEIFTGAKQEEQSKLFKWADQYLQFEKVKNSKISQLFGLADQFENKQKALAEIRGIIKAKQYQLMLEQHKPKLWKKSKSAFSYFFVSGALFGLGILSKDGTLDDDDCNYLEPIIFDQFGLGSNLRIPLHPNKKTTVTLFGLGIASAYYGFKDLYEGLFHSRIVKDNLENIDEIKKIISSL